MIVSQFSGEMGPEFGPKIAVKSLTSQQIVRIHQLFRQAKFDDPSGDVSQLILISLSLELEFWHWYFCITVYSIWIWFAIFLNSVSVQQVSTTFDWEL